jgi:hypothetical protein
MVDILTPSSFLVPYSRFPVIKNKKPEESIEIIKLKLLSRHLYPLGVYRLPEGCKGKEAVLSS